jgi:hypothetical protein
LLFQRNRRKNPAGKRASYSLREGGKPLLSEEITKATKPVVESFPLGKLFFQNGENPWLESFRFEQDEALEIEPGLSRIQLGPDIVIMVTSGYVQDEQGRDYIVSAIYGYNEQVYFLAVDYKDKRHIYDFHSKKWKH